MRLILPYYLFLSFLFFSLTVLAQSSDNQEVLTEGTFQFESSSGKTLFWKMDFIESLYPEIESRRSEEVPVYWRYNEDMTIIIFSREFIESEDFLPVASPYKGMNIKEIR